MNKTNTALESEVWMECYIKSIAYLLWEKCKCEPENIISQYAYIWFFVWPDYHIILKVL